MLSPPQIPVTLQVKWKSDTKSGTKTSSSSGRNQNRTQQKSQKPQWFTQNEILVLNLNLYVLKMKVRLCHTPHFHVIGHKGGRTFHRGNLPHYCKCYASHTEYRRLSENLLTVQLGVCMIFFTKQFLCCSVTFLPAQVKANIQLHWIPALLASVFLWLPAKWKYCLLG